ncbi:MAG: hypothetical protein Q8S31_01150 [Alphaproteobacteria bacterium]|nr:hypothetical protein [Alphaproteobacteria bacterium]
MLHISGYFNIYILRKYYTCLRQDNLKSILSYVLHPFKTDSEHPQQKDLAETKQGLF